MKQNENGVIVDRMVVKDSDFDKPKKAYLWDEALEVPTE